MSWLERIFSLKENKTSPKTELIGGATSFLAMIYIVPVNAGIMSHAGMPSQALIAATALITALACVLTAFFANTPVAMSVGMGLNAYFAFALCGAAGVAWQVALGAVFISSSIFFILALTPFRLWLIRSIPQDLRLAICAGIGCFIAFLGLSQMGLLVKDPSTLITLGNLSDPSLLFSLFTLVLIVLFWALKLRGALILGVGIASLIAWSFGLAQWPEKLFSLPNFTGPGGLGEIAGALDIRGAASLAMVPIILTFLITQLFDSIGTITGVGLRGGIFASQPGPTDPKNQAANAALPPHSPGEQKLARTLIAESAGSILGSLVGTSTVTAFVESSAGVEAGARTGLATLVVAGLFGLCLFFLPLFAAVPSGAIYPVLVMVGILMFAEVKKINFSDPATAVASFFTIFMMPLAYSITTGFAFGFLAYFLVLLFRREWGRVNASLLIFALISLLVLILAH